MAETTCRRLHRRRPAALIALKFLVVDCDDPSNTKSNFPMQSSQSILASAPAMKSCECFPPWFFSGTLASITGHLSGDSEDENPAYPPAHPFHLTCRLPIRAIVENTTSQTLAPVFSRWRCLTFISSSEPSQLTGLGSRNKNGPGPGNIHGTCRNLDPRPFTLQSATVRGKTNRKHFL